MVFVEQPLLFDVIPLKRRVLSPGESILHEDMTITILDNNTAHVIYEGRPGKTHVADDNNFLGGHAYQPGLFVVRRIRWQSRLKPTIYEKTVGLFNLKTLRRSTT